MIGQRPVDGGVRVRKRGAGSSCMPVGADDQARQQGRGDAVAHSVDDREFQEVVVERIVECVAGDVVGRLKEPRDDGASAAAVQRRQQIPLHARRQGHLPALPPDVGCVADQRHRRDGQAGEHAEQFNVLQDLGAQVRHRDRQHAGPAGLLRHRHPDADPVVPVGGDRLAGAERPACHRSRDHLAVGADGKRQQDVAGEVPEVDRGIPGRYRRARGGEHVLEIAAGNLPQDAEGVWVAGNIHCGSPHSAAHPARARCPARLSEMSLPKPRRRTARSDGRRRGLVGARSAPTARAARPAQPSCPATAGHSPPRDARIWFSIMRPRRFRMCGKARAAVLPVPSEHVPPRQAARCRKPHIKPLSDHGQCARLG
jgi:hypothetical protein